MREIGRSEVDGFKALLDDLQAMRTRIQELKAQLKEKSLDCLNLEIINKVLHEEIEEREQAQIQSNILCDRLNREIEELKELLKVPCDSCGRRFGE